MAAAMARPTPVLPLVGSTSVPPGLSTPPRSASSIIPRPSRSLTAPPGLSCSSFARTVGRRPLAMRVRRTMGVFPTSARTLSATCIEAMLVAPCQAAPHDRTARRATLFVGCDAQAALIHDERLVVLGELFHLPLHARDGLVAREPPWGPTRQVLEVLHPRAGVEHDHVLVLGDHARLAQLVRGLEGRGPLGAREQPLGHA